MQRLTIATGRISFASRYAGGRKKSKNGYSVTSSSRPSGSF